MCGSESKVLTPKPEQVLAQLMMRELGCNSCFLEPQKLKLFLLAYWDRVALLAHQIHDEKER
jgi:hypothetical protein